VVIVFLFSSATSWGLMMMMMMMMMMAVVLVTDAAVGKSGGHSKHRKPVDGGAALETVPLQIDPDALVPPRNLRPLQNASISPWTYNISRDDSLVPPMLSEARCLLRGCLDSDGKEDLSLESRPIMHQVLLLRRVKAGPGLESRLIAVGCTCVRPTVQQQD
uniref:Interleukin 17a/f1 n=1 Tax=Sphaeramia orbicularis TaxID=375764 RepID=A0A673BZV7_9TELE